ncbi:MarR family transcriptional regulator [Tistrella mobilis]|nr:MarR family transcriptional regulator [Tistrella mobilis]
MIPAMDHVDRILDQWHRERPDLDLGPMGLIGRLTRLMTHLMREMEKTFATHGLAYPSFDVLATLRRSGPPYALSPGDLMATTMVASGTMTNRIDQLEKSGLVQRRPNPQDGRSVLIALTDQGRRVIDAAVADHVLTQKRLVGHLSAAEQAALDTLLRDFLAGLDPAS